MHPIREQFEYVLAKGFFTLLRYCPAAITYGFCRLLAFLFYALCSSRRKITLKNLQIAFPEHTPNERKQMAWAAYDNFGRFIAESVMIMAGKLTKEDLLAMIDDSELEKLLNMEQASDKGILFITGHLGNFELLAHYTGIQLKRTAHVVARKGTNKLIDDRIVTPLRESFGNTVIYKSRALPRVARALKKGEHVGLLIDIKSNPSQGVPVTFFGQETYAIKSSAYLQIKLDAPVIPITMARIASGKYKLVTGEQVHWTNDGKSEEEQVAELTQIHQAALENLIRQYPDQWFWMHDRWKR
ncbi:lysophospholipid acyltransferase family protein [Verrucomicrobiota bacterium]